MDKADNGGAMPCLEAAEEGFLQKPCHYLSSKLQSLLAGSIHGQGEPVQWSERARSGGCSVLFLKVEKKNLVHPSLK